MRGTAEQWRALGAACKLNLIHGRLFLGPPDPHSPEAPLPMRLLTYNFVQPGDPRSGAKGGGGVAIYHANLVHALQSAGHDLVCMSSGDRYDPVPGSSPARLASRRDTVERVEVVNSPVFAPAHSVFHQIKRYTADPGLDAIPAMLRARYGRFDALHFQNVEGLSAGFFRRLRRAYPDSTILVSAHNYNLVCPQVNLWFREHQVCKDYRGGRACINCLVTPDRSRHELNIRRMDAILSRMGLPREGRAVSAAKWALRAPFRLARRLHRERSSASVPLLIQDPDRARDYAAYREINIALTGEVFDQVLAVSERTRQVLAERGMPAERIALCPIGTTHHAHFLKARHISSVEGEVALGLPRLHAGRQGLLFLARRAGSVARLLGGRDQRDHRRPDHRLARGRAAARRRAPLPQHPGA